MGVLRTFLAGVSLCLFLACGAVCQENAGFTIGGTVVQADTNRPMNRVLVTITQARSPEHGLSTVTTSDGHFGFSGLPAGKYSLTAQVGTAPARAFREDGQYSTAIVTGPNLDTEHIVFAVEPSSSISGSVVDEEGEPVRQAQVHLFRQGVVNGRKRILNFGQDNTDAAGQFYWGHLEPGIYFIGVVARPWYAQNFRPTDSSPANSAAPDLDLAYPVTYSGNSTDSESAAPIQIAAGSPATVEIALRPVPALHIKVDGLPAQTSTPVNVGLSAVGPGGVSIPVNAGIYSPLPNDREMTGIAPGKYWLTAQRFQPGRSPEINRQEIEISGDSTLDLGSSPPSNVSGKLTFEEGDPPSRQPVVLLGDGGNGRNTSFLRVGADGVLAANGATLPGDYDLALANAPGFYLKSVSVKGGSYSGGVLQIPESGTVRLSLVAAKGLSDVDGIALQDGKPAAGVMVLLLSQKSNSAYIPRDQSDSDGTFTLPNVPPGNYTLVAIDDGRDLPYADTEVMKPYLAGGQTVSISLANEAKLKISVQARQK